MSAAGGVPEQILDAAVVAATAHGITKLSMGDVARQAGLSRQTLYRHFPSKDALIAAVVAAETDSLIAEVVGAGAGHDDPRDSLEAALLAALNATRDHPLLDRLIRTEPEALLPLLITDGGPVMARVRSVVGAIIEEQVAPLDPDRGRRLADIVARLLVSYAVSAPDDPPEAVAEAIATFLVDGALRETSASAVDPSR